MPSDRTDDRGNRVCREGHPPIGFEAIHCIDESNGSGLYYIIEWFAAVRVAPSNVANQGKMHLDEFVTSASTLVRGCPGICQSREEGVFEVPAIGLVRCLGFRGHRDFSGTQRVIARKGPLQLCRGVRHGEVDGID